jgi:ribosomal protein L11 methyltransferase
VIRLAVRVARDRAEIALSELLELQPSGVEEVELDDGSIEYAVYGAPGELPSLPNLRAAVGPALVEISTREVADDWAERWKRFHHPITVSDPDGRPRLRVRPPWSEPDPGVALDVVIDPGQAFGTGAHPSTRLSLSLLVELAHRGLARGALCDVGCGSGVLAIAGARLGWTPVVAVDHESESVSATTANAAVNGVHVDVSGLDLRRQAPPRAPTMVANLLRPLLLDLAAALAASPGEEPPPRTLIASGLLHHEVDEVAGAFGERAGLHERRRCSDGEWSALLLSRNVGQETLATDH